MAEGAELELVPAQEVAKALKTTNRKVIMMIKNGTMPIGAVAEPEENEGRYVVKIVKTRWDKWQAGNI